MNTVLSWRQPSRRALTALAEKWEQWCSTSKGELLVAGITAPILVVLVVWLGIALGLPLMWTQVAATILGLALVIPFMRNSTPVSIQIETGEIRSIAQTSPVADVPSFYEDQDCEGWCGPMVNLTSEELEFLSERIGEYLEGNDDLNHTEFGFAKALLDKIDEELA